jgi:hypothetical protein
MFTTLTHQDRELKKAVDYQKPDMDACLKSLKELQTLAVTQFMFKKQPAIVQVSKLYNLLSVSLTLKPILDNSFQPCIIFVG